MSDVKWIKLQCQNCGSKLLPQKGNSNIYECECCGKTYKREIAEDVAEQLRSVLNEQKQGLVANLRQRLYNEVTKKDVSNSNVEKLCNQILNYLPEDVYANFYLATCCNSKMALGIFFDSLDINKYYDDIPGFLDYVLKALKPEWTTATADLIDRAYKKNNLKQNDLKLYNKYRTWFNIENKKIDECVYQTDFPRNVFIAYSTKDMINVEELISVLEENELTCFVAIRNLRHGSGAVENYEKAIKDAIDHCEVVVFVSSDNSRTLQCNAYEELSYIDKKHGKMPRVELLLNDYKNNSVERFFKKFFSGLEYCTTPQDVANRVCDIIMNGATAGEQGTTETLAVKIIKTKLKKLSILISSGKFDGVADSLSRLEIECESGGYNSVLAEVYYYKMLTNCKACNDSEFVNKFIKSGGDITKNINFGYAKGFAESGSPLAKKLNKIKIQYEKGIAKFRKDAARKAKTERKAKEAAARNAQKEADQKAREEAVRKAETDRKAREEAARKAKENADVKANVTAARHTKEDTDHKAETERKAKEAAVRKEKEEGARKAKEEAVRKAKEKAARKAKEKTDRKAKREAERKVREEERHRKIFEKQELKRPEAERVQIARDFDIENGVIIKYKGKGGKVTIPNGVSSIGEKAFYKCDSLTSITIPKSVTSIGDSAFEYCDSLTSITIPNSVTSIGDSAFWSCSSLTSITIPKSVTSIDDYAFGSCSSLTSITIPNRVTSIGDSAFEDCDSLTSITIPNRVTSIGEEAFNCCKSLTSINVSSYNRKYKSIDGNLYSRNGKTLLQYAIGKTAKFFTIPNRVTSIGDSAFGDCDSLTGITIPNRVTSIGEWAFAWCDSLTSITIPNRVASIGDLAFSNCESLTRINVSSDNRSYRSIDGNLYSYDGKTLLRYAIGKTAKSFTIPNGVTSIDSWAFADCKSLTSITIPNSVTSIDSFAFSNCESLTSITIPQSVTFVGYHVFAGCKSLKAIYCRIQKPLSGLPSGWNDKWLDKCNAQVIWNYKG